MVFLYINFVPFYFLQCIAIASQKIVRVEGGTFLNLLLQEVFLLLLLGSLFILKFLPVTHSEIKQVETLSLRANYKAVTIVSSILWWEEVQAIMMLYL